MCVRRTWERDELPGNTTLVRRASLWDVSTPSNRRIRKGPNTSRWPEVCPGVVGSQVLTSNRTALRDVPPHGAGGAGDEDGWRAHTVAWRGMQAKLTSFKQMCSTAQRSGDGRVGVFRRHSQTPPSKPIDLAFRDCCRVRQISVALVWEAAEQDLGGLCRSFPDWDPRRDDEEAVLNDVHETSEVSFHSLQ